MTKRKPKSKKHDLTKLSESQVVFIHSKVVQLGSVEAVASFYRKDDTVCAFARLVARGVYGRVE